MTHDSESFSHSGALADNARTPPAQPPISLIIATLLLASLGYPTCSAAQSTIICPSGTYDMLDWMTLDSSLRSTYHLEGTSNPLYTVMQPNKFYWVKGGGGSPWDIQLYDSKYIYLWITELSWTVPQSYKKFTNNTNLPLVPRCATAGTPGSTIKVANTNYDLHTNCSQTCSVTLGLQNAINQVGGPYYFSFGGSLPSNLKTLVISYRYNCDSNYQNCNDKEESITSRNVMDSYNGSTTFVFLPLEHMRSCRRQFSTN